MQPAANMPRPCFLILTVTRTQPCRSTFLAQFPGGAPRAVEDIKARYYSVARQLLTGRDGGAEGVGNQAIIKHPYNPEHERCAPNAACQAA